MVLVPTLMLNLLLDLDLTFLIDMYMAVLCSHWLS